MEKIRVVQHSKSVGYSGTDRTCQLFCKYLAQGDKYEPFLVYRAQDNNERLDIMKGILGEEHVVPYDWFPGKKGRQSPFLPEKDNLHEVFTAIDPQIIHLHRSGYNEWPGFKYMYPKAKWVETNIFGYNDSSPERQMDVNIYISQWIRDLAVKAGNQDGPVIFNPIEEPYLEMTPENKQLCRQMLLDTFGLPDDAVLLGRVGRADNFDGISLRAFKLLYDEFPQAYYLVVNGCARWQEEAVRLGIQDRIKFIDPIIGDEDLSAFYRGLDIYAHARNDGECCPCNIQEAMMHNIPIVSHESPTHNGQIEIVGDGGFVVPYGDHVNYAEVLKTLISNTSRVCDDERGGVIKLVRDHFGRAARARAMKSFEASCMTYTLTKVYDWLLESV